MKAALLTGIRQMEIRDVPDPQITTAGEVLLRINAVGVCGSDVHYYTTGRIASLVVEHPCMTGHECAATVVEASPEVKNLEAGQRVAVDPLVWCGHCDQCLAGRRHTCRNQTFLACPGQAPGALAEYLVMPAANCFPVPGNMNDDEATTIEPLSIGLHAQRLAGRPGPRRAAILGVGPIGLSVLLCLRAAGTKEIFVTDLLEERLAMARRLGADWTGRPTQQDVVAEMLQRVPEGMRLRMRRPAGDAGPGRRSSCPRRVADADRYPARAVGAIQAGDDPPQGTPPAKRAQTKRMRPGRD